MMGLVPSVPINRMSLMEMCEQAGLGSSVQLVLDPASKESYPGTGQIFYDISGNSRHFYLGSNSSVEASDPTFNGTAGALDSSCYFSSPSGGVGFTKTTPNDSFLNSLHQANWLWSSLRIDYYTSGYGSGYSTVVGAINGSNTGVTSYMVAGTGTYYPQYETNGGGNRIAFQPTSSGIAFAPNTITLLGHGTQYVNTTSRNYNGIVAGGQYFSANFTNSFTPDSGAAGWPFMVGLTSDSSTSMSSGRRMYGFMLFSTMLTQTQFSTIRTIIQTRHPGV